MQQTLQKSVTFKGIGLHSGAEVIMTMRPAGEDAGICFVRTDVADRDNHIPALWDRVVDTRLCTVIGNEAGVTVGTVEHLMAALRGCGVDNVIIELDGPEVPIMDGSSAPFIEKIDEAGIRKLAKMRTAIKVLKEIKVEQDGKTVSLTPGDVPSFVGEIEFDHPAIGHQHQQIKLVNGNFRHNFANARTFGFVEEVEALRKHGLALGGSLENAIVLDRDKIMNEDGLRHEDEFIRHKLLDAIGDLYLAGAPIIGTYEGTKGGHAMNNALLHKLFADKEAWTLVDMEEARREAVH
ncbi:MAG: UDP-3-O-acyl-N-acetylglucosamine deacetylase [Rhodospirillales bacterium]|nr:UDP-3-O-acyl-N-acetylglucosamine deacetylase [Rhodospirillales bacterium]